MKGYKHLFRKKSLHHIMSDSEIENPQSTHLAKSLGLWDLTALGVAAIVGAGIFSTIGNASVSGGPAVSLLFVFTAFACVFSAMCYAEFASRIPVSGSAYTYAYATFGELVAWIIGWDLLMEYAIGNIAVAISWSDYFTSFLGGLGIRVPDFLGMDYLSAMRGYKEAAASLANGQLLQNLTPSLQQAYNAWVHAPSLFGLKLIADIPALGIVILLTYLAYVGIQESKKANNIMVMIKMAVVLLVIAVGFFYVTPNNWLPFAPNGANGVLKGVSAVFFAYIGFDAISTTAEECKNPKRDLPSAMFLSLLICTILYILICFVLTGMVNYKELGVGDPLLYVFQKHNLHWISGIIAVSAIVAMASVLLVFQIGQPRIWMSMGRDGLLPKKFAKIHPKYQTPAFSTIMTGLLVAVPALFMNLTEVTDLTSIGTLFAFALVCAGTLKLGPLPKKEETKHLFKIPYINSRYIAPILFILTIAVCFFYNRAGVTAFFEFKNFHEQIPMTIFLLISMIITINCYRKKLSLIPVIGLVINLYLMTELGVHNWIGFGIWLVIGLVIYFTYSLKNSNLADAG